jgi:integrase
VRDAGDLLHGPGPLASKRLRTGRRGETARGAGRPFAEVYWIAAGVQGTPQSKSLQPCGARQPDPRDARSTLAGSCPGADGPDSFTLHELRHSALDRIYRETGGLYAAKQLARHASVRTTEEYLHPSADDLRARMLESDRESVHKPSRSRAVRKSNAR